MFIGHFAVGFSSKRVAPRTSLVLLLAAPLLADLLWPVLLLLGVERVQINAPGGNPFLLLTFTAYPWSHSLATSVLWAALFAGAYFALTRYRRGAWVIGAAVLSHWLLDYVTHLPDLPLAPGVGVLVGLGLWRSIAATIVVEVVMFVAGVWLYTAGTVARDGVGRYAWWALVLLTGLAYLTSLRGSAPASVPALAWTAVAGSVVSIWLAWLADRHRTVRGA
jgi:hypothetical protein